MDGAQMRALRTRHNLSQRQLAEILGVTSNYVSEMERDRKVVSDRMEAKLSEWDGEALPLDELPEPPYDPTADEGPDDREDERASPSSSPGRTRSSGPRRKKLTAWQEETAGQLTALITGTQDVIEVNGEQYPVFVPGLCTLIAQVDQFDAAILAGGAPGFSVALVKVAPNHPWLKALVEMLTMGGEYGELARASLAIAVPILMHHGVIPMPGARPMPGASENGAGNGDGEG